MAPFPGPAPRHRQPPADSEGLGDACDPCPNSADCDTDAFTDYAEVYLGTDPLDNCPDNTSDDAWPLDNTMDKKVDVLGDVLAYRGRINARPGDPNWLQRLDLNMDAIIDVLGDVLMYRGHINDTCT